MKEPEEPMFTITATDRHGILYHGRIRRLVPRECLRLQGYYDWQIDKIIDSTSDAQLYKQAGNGVTVNGTTSFSYDKYGNLVKETDPLGRSNIYSYDLAGQMTSAADPLGKITAYTYDPAGNITEITKPGGRKTSYGYDKNYNVTSVTDPMGYVAKTVYDKDNRVTEETDALGQKESYTYDKDSRVTSITDKRGFTTGFDYDAHGNIQVVTDKTGLKSHLEYDKNDNLTKVTDALGGVTTYGYDNMDNLVTFTNAANKTTNYTYDLEGNLTSIKDPAGRTEKFDYDEKGRLTGHTQVSGKKTTYDYDKLNDLLEKSYQDAKGEKSEKDVTYAYNSAGERVSMKDQTGKSSYEYDALGRITKVTSGSKKDVSYVYDDADNLQAIVYPDGTKISYEYDLNDNLVKLTDRNGKVTTYKHDALNRVTEVIRSNGTKTEVSYDAEDHITKIVNTCGSCGKVISTYEYKYNDQGYVVGETATELEAGTRKTPSWEDWYNWGGTKKETSKADCEHQEKEIQTTRTYEYDDNWELTRCTEKVEGGKKTVHNYTYDKIGNRTSYEKIEDGVSKAKYNYKYNDSNQLIKRTNAKIWNDPGTTYSYDEDGNLIQECDKTNSADPVTYEYTAENRLAVVKQGGTVLMAAMYDGDNNRVFELDNTYKWEDCYGDEVLIPENQRTEDGDSPKEQLASLVKSGSNAKGYTLTEYINDINRENTEVLAEYGADEKVRQAYTYGESGIGERVSVDKSEESSYYLYDGRNSVTGILTENANLTNSYQYDPYGNLTSGTADGVNYYGYNGESTNVKTGLQYLRARYYDAENGTFTTEDSDLGTTENPLTRNRYDYTTNNPLNYSDPTGHSLWSRIKSTAKKAAKAVKSVGKKIVNTAKKVVKTVVNTAKKAAKTIVNAVKGAAKTVKNAVTHPKKTYQSVRSSVTNSYRKVVSRGNSFVRSVSNGVQKIGKTYTSFKSYVSERTSEIRSEVVRHMCTTTNRITDQLGKVNWKNVAIGVTAMVVSGVVVAATGGLAAGAVLAALPAMGGLGTAMVSGAVAGAIGGASYGAISSGLSGNSLKQVAKDTLTGGLTGAISGGILGGLTYGAGKAIGAVKNLVKGSSNATKPGHITEMATKNLTGNSSNGDQLLLEDKRAGQLLLEDKQSGQLLLEDKRAGQLLLEDKHTQVEYGQQYERVNNKKVLKSNIQYEDSNGYKYTTGNNGEIIEVNGKLELGSGTRNGYAQRTVGGADRLSTDDGGHLIGSQFNGSGNIDNLVPQSKNINRAGGEWYNLEKSWSSALKAGSEVEVDIRNVYEGGSMRPNSFDVNYKIDGIKYEKKIKNL